MANIAIRRDAGQVTPTRAAEFDPFRLMRDWMRWDPFREMAPTFAPEREGFYPAFDVKETDHTYVFRADLPGVRGADVEVTMQGNRLQVSGKREADHEERTDTYYTYERSYGSFLRSFTLPQEADMKNIHSDLTDGVLTISVGKLPSAQPRKIEIKAGAHKPRA
jgi:HSP20 family protein